VDGHHPAGAQPPRLTGVGRYVWTSPLVRSTCCTPDTPPIQTPPRASSAAPYQSSPPATVGRGKAGEALRLAVEGERPALGGHQQGPVLQLAELPDVVIGKRARVVGS
jgi:hypothetical protein